MTNCNKEMKQNGKWLKKKLKQIIKYHSKNLHLYAIICWQQCHERIKVRKRILNVPVKGNQCNVFSSNAFLRRRN